MSLPRFVNIKEVGPREGMQFEKGPIPTQAKIELVDALSECGFRRIEVTSFVSPKWVPQMADADEVARGFQRHPGVEYSAIFLNTQGLERAVATQKFDVRGTLWATASETFSKRNTNKGIEETYCDLEARLKAFQALGLPVDGVGAMAAFGCNFEGDVDPDKVVGMIARLMEIGERNGAPMSRIALADTMGWATPPRMKQLLGKIRERWPDKPINLHLHDTRGLGLANAFAAMEMGVDDFDSAVGGLGGCPYGGFAGAAGNICTEDFVHMCSELGIETGIDLDKLIEVARMAERIVGHPLPSKLMQGRPLQSYRTALAA